MPSYVEQNRAAAAVILADPRRHDGALLQWARLIEERPASQPATAPGHARSGEHGPVARLVAKG